MEEKQFTVLHKYLNECTKKYIESLIKWQEEMKDPSNESQQEKALREAFTYIANYVYSPGSHHYMALLKLTEAITGKKVSAVKKPVDSKPFPASGSVIVFTAAPPAFQYPFGIPVLMLTSCTGMTLSGAHGFGNISWSEKIGFREATQDEMDQLVKSFNALLVIPPALKKIIESATKNEERKNPNSY